MSEDNDDIFSDNYVSERKRKFESIEHIARSVDESDEKQERWQKNTRKRSNPGPEDKVKDKIKAHLVNTYNAKVLRTNAGSIVDKFGNTIWLGETGQSDFHALIPFNIEGIVIGLFAAIEVKAVGSKPSDEKLVDIESIKEKRIKNQERYLRYVRSRGGIGCFADCVEDVDRAVLGKMLEIQAKLATANVLSKSLDK